MIKVWLNRPRGVEDHLLAIHQAAGEALHLREAAAAGLAVVRVAGAHPDAIDEGARADQGSHHTVCLSGTLEQAAAFFARLEGLGCEMSQYVVEVPPGGDCFGDREYLDDHADRCSFFVDESSDEQAWRFGLPE